MQRMQVIVVFLFCVAYGVYAVKDAFTGYDRERVICPTKSRVWGPGLESDFIVPARYFYIQAVDFENNSFTYSPGDKAFQVNIKPANGRGRIWTQILDRHDGSFIVRYRMYDTYPELHIEVMSGDRHVADSPYVMQGPVYDEKCYCPEEEPQWRENMHCPTNIHPQIIRDLSPFPSINIDRLAEEAIQRFARYHSLCHYVIVDNHIYRKTHGEHVGFKMFSDAFLTSLARKVHIPDVEFFVNLGDWPLEKRAVTDSPLPILSWCGSDETQDIVMPTYDVTESTLETMGRVSLDLLSVQANTGPKWENKTEQGFWRGRDSRQERLDLVKLSRKKPDLIDAALTNFFFFPQNDDLYGPKVKHVSFFDFFKYKYQINVDGTVAAYRLPYLLAGDSVVFKHDSIYYEHFYNDLKPWEHYIPYSKDLTDLEERIVWAQEHDDEAQQIAENARTYVRENLLANNIFCYYYQLIKEYASRQTRQPTVRDGMEEVEQPSDSKCTCHRIDPVSNQQPIRTDL